MKVIVDSKINIDISIFDMPIILDLDKVHSLDGENKDKVLTLYKELVEHNADLVIVSDKEVAEKLAKEKVNVLLGVS